MRKLIVLSTFLTVTPIALFLVITLLLSGNLVTSKSLRLQFQPRYMLFQALPQNSSTTSNSLSSTDARTLLIEKFFSKYNSPLKPYSSLIVQLSDQYKIDYRLLPAISMQESTGCKFVPEDSYNCWGYGIYGDKITRFSGYDEGIETVIRGLKKNYYDKGLKSPQAIMRKYTPPSLEKGGAWASGVEYFFYDIEN